MRKASPTGMDGRDPVGPAGVRERGTHALGSSRNLGDPAASRQLVLRPEGNEGKRDGRQEVGALHGTDEAGEPNRRDPVEGRECRNTEPSEGTMSRTTDRQDISTKQRRIAEL